MSVAHQLEVSPNIPATVPHAVVIAPSNGWRALRIQDLWDYRELLYFLVWRDIKVRYKQTVLGAMWAILQPLLTMMIFSIFFGRLAKIPSDGVPYPIFCFTGLVPWMLFAYGLNQSSASLIANSNLVTKVYFPRLSIPISTVLSGLVDCALSFGVLLCLMAYYQVPLRATMLWLPLFVLLTLITALGTGLWLASFNVQFRDVKYVVPFLTQFWMYATPIAYSSSSVPEAWRPIFGLNPMVGVVEGFRWAALGTNTAPGPMIAVSSAAAVALLAGGAFYFKRMEKTFADII